MSATSPDTGQPTRHVSTAALWHRLIGRQPAAPAGPGPRRHRDRAAHGRARRDHRQRRPAAHPGRTPLLRQQPGVGRQRLRTGLRRPAAARRKVWRPTGAPPDLHPRHLAVLDRLAARRVRHRPGLAPRRARLAGHRRRVRRAHRAVADRGYLPRGPTAQPRDGCVRRDERGRRGRRPDRGRPAGPVPRLALGVLRERADRPGARVPRPPRARRVRAAARCLRLAGCHHRQPRPGRPRLRPVQRRDQPERRVALG